MTNKMTNKAMKIYSELPTWAKGTVVVGGIAITYFTARGIWKQIKKNIDAQNAQKSVAETKRDLKDLQNQGINPSYSSSQYLNWSDGIQKVFGGCDWGQPLLSTLFDMNYNYFGLGDVAWSGSGRYFSAIIDKMKNDADVISLSIAYGVRSYSKCSVLWGLWGGGTSTGSLTQAVSDELNSDEIKTLNKMLAKKGIKFSF